MKKKIIIILAEYLVILEGGLLFYLSLGAHTFIEQIRILVVAVILLTFSLIISKILKKVINKSRSPNMQEYFIPHDKYAFPSGHATGLASVTIFLFFNSIILGTLGLMLTLFTVIARVKSHVHDSYDIVAGLVLGSSITFFLFTPVTTFVAKYVVPLLLSM